MKEDYHIECFKNWIRWCIRTAEKPQGSLFIFKFIKNNFFFTTLTTYGSSGAWDGIWAAAAQGYFKNESRVSVLCSYLPVTSQGTVTNVQAPRVACEVLAPRSLPGTSIGSSSLSPVTSDLLSFLSFFFFPDHNYPDNLQVETQTNWPNGLSLGSREQEGISRNAGAFMWKIPLRWI